ncbi:MAG: putative transposase [Oceanicoccus sp.]|jgi:putative transposase
MARLPRLYVPGCAHHIIQRGNNRQVCFFDDLDYGFYLDKLNEAREKSQVSIHAFVLMTNHVHLLATPHDQYGISRMMQSLGRRYVGYVNATYQRTGTLWEGRYKSTLVDSENFLLTVSRYIELNPVRAGMVDHPSEYPWSSYRGNAMGKEIKILTPHSSYRQLGKAQEDRQQAYRTLFRGRIAERTLAEIREATNKAWVLGDNRFKEEIKAMASRQIESSGWGGDRKSMAYLDDQGV